MYQSIYDLQQAPQQPEKTVRLFHYTSDWHISGIRAHGLVPRAPALFLHGDGCTYFTTHEQPDAGHGLNDFKTEWRLEVDTDKLPGVRVVHWLTYAREQGLDEVIIDAAVRTGGGPQAAESWWIALDPIAPEQILSQHNRYQQKKARSTPMKAAVVREDTGEVLRECRDIPEAEGVIAEIEKTDPSGVHAGNYGIDADEEAYIAYQSTPRTPGESTPSQDDNALDDFMLVLMTEIAPPMDKYPSGTDLNAAYKALSHVPDEAKANFFLIEQESLDGMSALEALAQGMKDKVIAAAKASSAETIQRPKPRSAGPGF